MDSDGLSLSGADLLRLDWTRAWSRADWVDRPAESEVAGAIGQTAVGAGEAAIAPVAFDAPSGLRSSTDAIAVGWETADAATATAIAPASLAQQQPRSDRDNFGTAVLIAAPIVLALLIIWAINTIVRICDPNKILVISGRQQRVDGQSLGYRVEFGGQTYCIPIIETVESMDMRTMPVPIEVRNAYSKGGTPLDIQAIANVKISRDPIVVRNAIERFLGRNPEEIRRVARETLEGNLRGVVATLTPEQLNEDRLRFAERIAADVSDDLAKLGLQLDILKIQSVSDDVDYLNSIGRKQIANIRRDAEIAESDAVTEAEQIEAECQRTSEVARTQARTLIQQQENELRKIAADLDRQARSEEERTKAAAQEARALAEEQLQTLRAELERLRLEADEVLPADANRQASELLARGEAAALAENARAAAAVNDLLSKVWRESGADASDLFALQQLETVLQEAARVSDRLRLQRIHAIDSGDGRTLSGLVNAYPQIVRQFLEQVEQTLAIDVLGGKGMDRNGDRAALAAIDGETAPDAPEG